MAKKAFIVTGLGYGDEGKGTTTHWLSHRHRAHTVVRVGGPQALHHVVTSNGDAHTFSQFGSGTFRGSATHISKHMLVDPHALLKEGEALTYGIGIRGLFELMTIHEDALIITPFQAIAGRVRELLRGKDRHSSVGIGVGETILDAEILKDGALRAQDLKSKDLREKICAIKAYKWSQFEEYADRASAIPSGTKELVLAELSEMGNDDTIEWAIERFGELARRVRIVDTDYVATHILGTEGTVVFEGSQGVLLDRYHGFHPYTTKVRTTPAQARDILRETGYGGEVQSLGILRAYQTRHGNGPFVTEDNCLTKKLPDLMNKNHRWQGNFRVGHLDIVATKYAIDACGTGGIDTLVLTCLDRVLPFGMWQICDSYHCGTESVTQLKANPDAGDRAQLERQREMCRFLEKCSPQLSTFYISQYAQDEFVPFARRIIEEVLRTPLMVISVGETEQNKIEMK